MSPSPVILILGGGKNVGASVAKRFAGQGYKVALVARNSQSTTNSENSMTISADLADADSLSHVFDRVEQKFGTPNVVVYNAASVKPVPRDDPLQLDVSDLNNDFAVNTASVLAAAKRAIQGFAKLPSEMNKTFIYTGNLLNIEVMPALVSLGIGKSATAHLVKTAAQAYGAQGYHFYYADERKADGSAAFMDINGPNHAEFYYELAEDKQQRPWWQTFVGGQGYKSFPVKLA
ncbi:hypothetical protein BAUCODRAFT_32810 [Baudoinia panamericana UAMH 10762]|uniref:Short chain type dehydrogenase n=1 Tax=Baudoinia panamericana (strain UAMH 10762) TaxID=717646 RepID=M2MK51_BAUPA|nr:uncharacterized protein BAUCODRAFT_32810 [Baudoinia panamericana UAMH 10762]EMC97066.1 hypothetical protein BAUCODRAFT_32810 [Baudoinia panamericana UAMH 10762]